MEQPCGLITGNKEPVPLKSISVTLSINDFVASVSATLNYENEEKVPLEAIFVFPMDEDSAVYSFEALVDGKKIVAELQEKMEAHSTYEDALSQGYQAYLLEEDDYSRDVFSCNVGNLQPGAKVAVTLRYVQELPLEIDGALRYLLPAILNPRYQLSESPVLSQAFSDPGQLALDGDPSVWATVLAVLWLHGKGKDLKCEWELLERKAVAWLHDHAGSSIPMLVQAGSNLLKLPVTPAVFGF
ncbi:von Willebrand factor A domain-containing protein 5A [Microtus ochrogaster]|uniref:von Willebrand factor A domain-containing protein 5A n=1 Tax=Microtus ochrogaster TaxID=79684 RepID=A0A8J6GQP4_MICOH|nr:von Willebrand factor A domain-containing protein 5A [Microtus ochrogaster]